MSISPGRKEQRSSLDPTFVKALAHPLRQDILASLNEGVGSPREIADKLDEPLGNVSYHVRKLLEKGFIELVRTEPRRGAVEHFYRALQRPFLSHEDLEKLPITTRRAMFDRVIRRCLNDVVRAGEANGFDAAEAHVSRTELALDERAWRELSNKLEELLDYALELQAQSAKRTAAEGTRTIRAKLCVLYFQGATASRRFTTSGRRVSGRHGG